MKNSFSKLKPICTIVSHTPYSFDSEGAIVGLGPTIEEIDHLGSLFSKVFHCAPIENKIAPPSFIKHKNTNVHLIPLEPAGGDTLRKKIMHILLFPKHLKQIKSCLIDSDILHVRAPTGINILLLPWILIFWRKLTWVKYAGAWEDSSAPLTYKFQRWLLKVSPERVKVSINNKISRKKRNFFQFINPCFSESSLANATKISRNKAFDKKLNILFVGRLEKAKGLDDLLLLLKKINNTEKINSLTIIGTSKIKHRYEEMAKNIPFKTIFTGSISRKEVFKYYAKSHILVLLSKTEGFPKVIMEGGSFGCVPIVSNIPNITEKIIHRYNGFILEPESVSIKAKSFKNILNDTTKLKLCSKNIIIDAKKFTFENYLSQIKNAFLSKTSQ